jgi:hypothetical protein
MTVTMNTTVTGLSPGEWCYLGGLIGSAAQYIGSYKVIRLTGTTYELSADGADFGSIATGGAVIKMTDVRIHYAKTLDYSRVLVDLVNARGVNADRSRALTVCGDLGTVSTVSSITAANLNIPGIIVDIASAALTSTTTTAAITPTFGISYEVNIPVTAVTGTSPTLDVEIQESDDNGTNWYPVYDFPRITTTGIYRSPLLRLVGNRVRYVQTVGGTSPSFTRALNRLQSSFNTQSLNRQIVDRTIVLTTLNSATPILNIQGCNNLSITVNVGAITTTAPALQLQVSDDNALTWTSIGSPLTAVANSSVTATVANVSYQFARVIVSTAGVGVTAGFVLFKGF